MEAENQTQRATVPLLPPTKSLATKCIAPSNADAHMMQAPLLVQSKQNVLQKSRQTINVMARQRSNLKD